MNKKIIFAVMLIAFVLAGCGNAGPSSNQGTNSESMPSAYAGKTNPLGAEAVPVGAKIFKDYCAACHGESGHGDGPSGAALEPHPKNLAALQPQVSDDYLFWRINNGKQGTAMAAWKGALTEEQIWQVIAFIRTLK